VCLARLTITGGGRRARRTCGCFDGSTSCIWIALFSAAVAWPSRWRSTANVPSRILGIEALYPKPNLSRPAPGHEIYPYLLRGVSIERPNQVWSSDIPYIPMHGGFLYLVAVMDWFSRFVLSRELSNTMETGFCLAALEAAFRFGQPEIWNFPQGNRADVL